MTSGGACFERYGDLIESLGGSYVTGPDVNTGDADMDVIGERTDHVFCRSLENGGSGDPSVHTALGVFHGIRATLAHALGSDDPAGRTVLVQGTGSVGAKLARLLLDAGAIVLVSDVDEERARATGGDAGRSRQRARAGVRRLCALRARRDAQRRFDPAAALPRRRRRREQPARDAGGRRAPAGRRDPVRARLRDQRRRRPARDRARERSAGTPTGSSARSPGSATRSAGIYRQADAAGITTSEAAERLAAERLAQA